mmetsp:Transcript_35160/g.54848  ORF Transcript_35160/g.54848 Transcript_35160/m.54848 type:complete len:348 (+) Transcript_35160:642-1685(+)
MITGIRVALIINHALSIVSVTIFIETTSVLRGEFVDIDSVKTTLSKISSNNVRITSVLIQDNIVRVTKFFFSLPTKGPIIMVGGSQSLRSIPRANKSLPQVLILVQIIDIKDLHTMIHIFGDNVGNSLVGLDITPDFVLGAIGHLEGTSLSTIVGRQESENNRFFGLGDINKGSTIRVANNRNVPNLTFTIFRVSVDIIITKNTNDFIIFLKILKINCHSPNITCFSSTSQQRSRNVRQQINIVTRVLSSPIFLKMKIDSDMSIMANLLVQTRNEATHSREVGGTKASRTAILKLNFFERHHFVGSNVREASLSTNSITNSIVLTIEGALLPVLCCQTEGQEGNEKE